MSFEKLARGGLWLETPVGALQLGAPPETLKDTLAKRGGVPRVVVLPSKLFDVDRGVALADLEFPIYYNLFAKSRPLVVVGRAAQREAVLAAVQESLLGPSDENHSDDVAPGRQVPNLGRERQWFRRGNAYQGGELSLVDAISFVPIDNDGAIVSDAATGAAIRVALDDNEATIVVTSLSDARELGRLPRDPPPLPAAVGLDDPVPHPPFSPPRFGVTVLGRSHGFDPDPRERTTGFIIWVAGRGVLVDPPVHAVEILRHADIDAGLIDGIILTHVHGDHDSGVLQCALSAGKTKLWTVPSIYRSWLRKWTALSSIPSPELGKLFDFRPVQVGAPVDINGAKLLFRFTLHSIPTITFEAHYGGASFNYSGDTLNEPEAVDAIHKGGCMDDARREELTHFDWSHDLIFHESGIPPLHTPLERLEALDDDVKARVRVLHVTPQRLVGRDGLIIAEPGRTGTLELPVEPPPDQRVIRNLSILGHTRLFHGLPLARAAELLRGARELHLKAGEQLIRQGDSGDALYVVTGGKALVKRDGRDLKTYGIGDYIGETAVFLRRPRNADVLALTDLEFLAIDGAPARRACEGTDVPFLVERHDRVRRLDAWTLLEETTLFRGMTSRQKNHLESILQPFEASTGHRLSSGGLVAERLGIIVNGVAVLCDGPAEESDAPQLVGRAGLVGDPAALLAQTPQANGAVANGKVTGLWLWRADLEAFLDENPAIRVRIQPWTAVTTSATAAEGMAAMVTEHMGR